MFELSLPPQLPGVVAAIIVLGGGTERYAHALAHAPQIVRLRQPIDRQRFTPVGPPHDRPQVALALGNYLRGPRRDLLEHACRAVGVELRSAGTLSAVDEHPEIAMAEADIVVGKGRVILEAMACGRPALLFDQSGYGGWVTPENYAAVEDDNFGGRGGAALDEAHLRQALGRYDPSLGLAGRELAMTHHSAIAHASSLATLLARLVPEPAPTTAVAEFGRMARMAWRLETNAMGARMAAEQHRLTVLARESERDAALERAQAQGKDVIALGTQVVALQADVGALQAQVSELRNAAAALEQQLAATLERARVAEERDASLRATRRFALMRRLVGPVDRWRNR
jgi:hypothetical protein